MIAEEMIRKAAFFMCSTLNLKIIVNGGSNCAACGTNYQEKSNCLKHDTFPELR